MKNPAPVWRLKVELLSVAPTGGSKPKTAEFLAILQNQWVMLSVRAMFGNQHEM